MARIVALDFGVLKALTVFLVLCPFTMQSHIFFTDGMEWKIVSAPVILPPPGECLSIYRLEGDSVCDGFRWFKMYYTVDANPESRRFAGMVRTEGDKVYYKDKYDTGLLYDFGLKPGEICFTGSLADDSEVAAPMRTTVFFGKAVGRSLSRPLSTGMLFFRWMIHISIPLPTIP